MSIFHGFLEPLSRSFRYIFLKEFFQRDPETRYLYLIPVLYNRSFYSDHTRVSSSFYRKPCKKDMGSLISSVDYTIKRKLEVFSGSSIDFRKEKIFLLFLVPVF